MSVCDPTPEVTGNAPSTTPSLLAATRSRESGLLVVVAVLVAFVIMEVRAIGGGVVLTRPLWLDEIHTLLLAGHGDLGGSIRSLAAGSDFNPPTLFLLYRLVGALCGGLSEVSMRLVALASVVSALAFVYWLLREDFGLVPSVLGTLAVWAQPIVTAVAFDARFYGPWLFGITALLVALRRAIDRPVSMTSGLLLASAAAFVCTIHYFGIVSWGVALAIAFARARSPWRQATRRLSAALAGPASLLACAPIYLGQRSALSVPTWIPAASVADHLVLLALILFPLTTVAAVAAWGATRLLAPLARRVADSTAPLLGTSGLLLLGQAAVPVVLAVFSLAVQPATQLRYWIAGALASAPIVAYAVSRTASALRVAVAVILVALSIGAMQDEATRARNRQETVREDVTAARRAIAEGTILVARRRHTLYPLLRAMPGLQTRAVLLGAGGGTQARWPDAQLLVVDRDVAKVHGRFYGFPRLMSPAQLATLSSFYFLELDSARVPEADEVPGHVIERVGARLYRIRPP